jgi:MoaA/NifB/PqqE/SkfB family radical SAM enzyme
MYHKNPPPLTKRIDLNVGYSCNIRCRFCYYINDVKARNKDKDLTTEECKKLISYHWKSGMKILEFTGGEPTIRKDLIELILYAKKIGFSYLSMITNGIRLADKNYARNVIDSGISDFLFSLHGSTAEMHDFITCIQGSYKRLLRAVENLLEMGVRVRFNSVVTGTNFHDIYERAKLFRRLGIKTVNFIMFNPIEQAGCSEDANYLQYTMVAPHLKKVIDDMGDVFDKLTIRYMPFCIMSGYEGYIQNVHQVHYDHDEWNYYQRAYIREPYWKWLGGIIVGLSILPRKKLWYTWGIEHMKHAAILEAHTWLHKCKPKPCKKCSYGFICGGVWKKYTSKFGDVELFPREGALIIEPWYFMNDKQRASHLMSS